MNFFRFFWFKYTFSRFRWYRRWYGGRWEYHYIDICHSAMWLDMLPDPKWQWPVHRQACSVGTPIIEDYPVRGIAPIQKIIEVDRQPLPEEESIR